MWRYCHASCQGQSQSRITFCFAKAQRTTVVPNCSRAAQGYACSAMAHNDRDECLGDAREGQPLSPDSGASTWLALSHTCLIPQARMRFTAIPTYLHLVPTAIDTPSSSACTCILHPKTHHVKPQFTQERPCIDTSMSPGEALPAPIGKDRVQRCAIPRA